MIELRLLEQLAAFYRCGTLSAAAEVLLISQPTLTRSMKQLEDELGIKLFVRGKNHISLNETGIRAAEYANQVLSQAEDFEMRIKAYDRSLHTISIGYCAPVPQLVMMPIINNVFSGMTISSDMKSDEKFEENLLQGIYQLAITHFKPENEKLFSKNCGSESLYMSFSQSNSLAFYPQVYLKDIDGLSVLLLSQIGFWADVHRKKTPNTKYLLQIEESSFIELAENSEYPNFTSSYFIDRNETMPGRINVKLADSECSTDYYLVCLECDKKKYEKLFNLVNENTVK